MNQYVPLATQTLLDQATLNMVLNIITALTALVTAFGVAWNIIRSGANRKNIAELKEHVNGKMTRLLDAEKKVSKIEGKAEAIAEIASLKEES